MRYYSARAAGAAGGASFGGLGISSGVSANNSVGAPLTPITTQDFVLNSSAPTQTTLTFTPSTLRNIEETFMEQDPSSVARPPVSHQHQAGFVTPQVTGVFPQLAQHRWQGGVTTVNAGGDDSFTSPLREHPRLVPQAGHRRGGRRPKDDDVSPEEELRRRQRRERNKQAAARCRRRRLELINTLQGETDDLERRRRGLEREIQHLQAQKEELAFLMDAHRGTCRVGKENAGHAQLDSHCDGAVVVKNEPAEVDDYSRATTSRQSLVTPPPPPEPRQRPTSLPVASFASHVTAGVPISTPSQGLGLNFDSMMAGGTGLTPISSSSMMVPMMSTASTTLATPVVTPQVDLRREDMLSPDSGNRHLVSL